MMARLYSACMTPWLAAFAKPVQRLGTVLRNAQTFMEHVAEVVLRESMPMFGGFAVPAKCLGVVATAESWGIEKTQIELCGRVPFCGGAQKPFLRFSRIAGDTATVGVKSPKIVLCDGVTTIGRLLVPLVCLKIILGNSSSGLVRPAYIGLGLCIAPCCFLQQLLNFAGMVDVRAGAEIC